MIENTQAKYLDSTGQDVPIVGHARSKRWSVVECVNGTPLALFERRLEGINGRPVLQNGVFNFGEADVFRDRSKHGVT